MSDEKGEGNVSGNLRLLRRVVVIVFLVGFLLVVVGLLVEKLIVIEVDEEDQYCQIDDDCVPVYFECGYVSREQSINKMYKDKYGVKHRLKCMFSDAVEDIFFNLGRGRGVPDMGSTWIYPRCVDKRCTMVRGPSIAYMGHCDRMRARYLDSGDLDDAVGYCEKYFEIDMNVNGKIRQEVAISGECGVCEERVYCFNIHECKGGSGTDDQLTPEKCKEIMCEVYSERYDSKETASRQIEEKMQFGSCDLDDDVIAGHTDWWTDNFRDVGCP